MSKVKKKKLIGTTNKTSSNRAASPRRSSGRSSSALVGGKSARELLPYFLSFCLLVCLTAIGVLGYRAVAASNFFEVSQVDVRNTIRSSRIEIESIVLSQTEKSGSWNADLGQIKIRVERLAFVRSASVSRVLPDGIRVAVVEREPAAIVNLASGPTLVDEAGRVIAPATKPEPEIPFAISGWDEAKSPQAEKDNLQRVKLYRTMLSEWKQVGLADRIEGVNIKDLRDPIVVTQDSGKRVAIAVGRDQFGENLKNGLMAITGKGDMFEGVALFGSNLKLIPRQTK